MRGKEAISRASLTSVSVAPSKTGLAMRMPPASLLATSMTSSSDRVFMNLLNSLVAYIFLTLSLTELGLRFFSIMADTALPRCFAAHPRWVSRICPMFIREGTPSGFRTMSTGVPSAR